MPAATISPDEVREIAALARLSLSDAEVTRLAEELGAILGYMESLAALDVGGVPPTTHAVPLDLVLRADAPGPELDVEQALADAPRRDGPYFVVPKIIEVGE